MQSPFTTPTALIRTGVRALATGRITPATIVTGRTTGIQAVFSKAMEVVRSNKGEILIYDNDAGYDAYSSEPKLVLHIDERNSTEIDCNPALSSIYIQQQKGKKEE